MGRAFDSRWETDLAPRVPVGKPRHHSVDRPAPVLHPDLIQAHHLRNAPGTEALAVIPQEIPLRLAAVERFYAAAADLDTLAVVEG